MKSIVLATHPQPGGHGVEDPELRQHVLRLGMWMFLATVVMLFAAFSSAYIVRGASPDWKPVPLPRILWLNTVVILASSACLEITRRQARAERWREARSWMLITMLFGLAFLAGQIGAWRQLAAVGIAVPTSPHGSFFFILTGLHGLHLVAGLVVLSFATARLAASTQSRPTRPEAALAIHGFMELGAIFWHFLAGLWVYLLIMLTFFR